MRPGSTVTDVNDEHDWNALVPNVVTELGIVIYCKEIQFEKALLPILVTESGIVIDARDAH